MGERIGGNGEWESELEAAVSGRVNQRQRPNSREIGDEQRPATSTIDHEPRKEKREHRTEMRSKRGKKMINERAVGE